MSRRNPRPTDVLVAESPVMQAVVHRVTELAEGDAPVLIQGERGSGRELIARVLHLSSRRGRAEFVAVHAELAPKVLHYDAARATSASTLRSAQGGTLLIKDVCDLPIESQRRLRELLGCGEAAAAEASKDGYDVRVVGSCDAVLGAAVEAEVFARDLYQALEQSAIDVPPLRERTADIVPLAEQCLRHFARELGRGRMSFSARGHERLLAYPWPGNVAELKSMTRRLVLSASAPRIGADEINALLPPVTHRVPLEDISFEEMIKSQLAEFLRKVEGYPIENLYDEVLARVEKPLLDLVMQRTGGNQVKAAEILGLNRNTLRRKLTERGIKTPVRDGRAVKTRRQTSKRKSTTRRGSRRTG